MSRLMEEFLKSRKNTRVYLPLTNGEVIEGILSDYDEEYMKILESSHIDYRGTSQILVPYIAVVKYK